MSKTCYMNVALTCVMKRSVFGGIGLTHFCLKIRKDRINCTRSYSNWQWYLNESFVKINGETHYRWRAVDHEGEVLESIVTKRHDRRAALKFLKKTMKSYGNPYVIATVCLKSSGVAMKVIGNARRQMTGRRLNNRAENSYLPFDDGSEQFYASDNRDVCRNSFRFILLFTTISTMNAISIHKPLSNSNELPHLLSGGNFVPPRFPHPTANSDISN